MHPENADLTKYLQPCTYIDFENRDEIFHSGDIDSERITRSTSEVLQYREGICLAKSKI